MRSKDRPSGTEHAALLAAAVIVAGLYVAGFLALSSSPSFSAPGGMALAPLLLAVWLLAARKLARRQSDPIMARLVLWSAAAHAAAALLRPATEIIFYGGIADAGLYIRGGSSLVGDVWSGHWAAMGWDLGTDAMISVTGIVLSLVGPTTVGAFITFSALAWVGLYCFLGAFQMSFPDRSPRRYGALVMFLPSLLFWPAIGKDAWLVFTLGVAAWAIARLYTTGRMSLALPLSLGGAVLVRPHMALMLLVAAGAGFVLGQSTRGPAVRVLGGGILAIGGVIVATQVQAFLNIDQISLDGVAEVAERISGTTSTGGSQFSNVGVTGLLTLPIGAISVLLRPFPWEAGNILALVASLETFALVVLTWRWRRTIAAGLRPVLRHPYGILALLFTVEFIVGFSNFNNLGLLARERAMMWPFLLVVVAMTPATRDEVSPVETVPVRRDRQAAA
jgi:hypothetical protein